MYLEILSNVLKYNVPVIQTDQTYAFQYGQQRTRKNIVDHPTHLLFTFYHFIFSLSFSTNCISFILYIYIYMGLFLWLIVTFFLAVESISKDSF